METTFRYVIQDENGLFFWKGHISSHYKFKSGFGDAFMFKSLYRAEERVKRLSSSQKCIIRKVELKLIS